MGKNVKGKKEKTVLAKKTHSPSMNKLEPRTSVFPLLPLAASDKNLTPLILAHT
jgi:hypothetical protein